MYAQSFDALDQVIHTLCWLGFCLGIFAGACVAAYYWAHHNAVKRHLRELQVCFEDNPGFYLFPDRDWATNESYHKLAGTDGVRYGIVVPDGFKLRLLLNGSTGYRTHDVIKDLSTCLDGSTWDGPAHLVDYGPPPAVPGCPGWRDWLIIDTTARPEMEATRR